MLPIFWLQSSNNACGGRQSLKLIISTKPKKDPLIKPQCTCQTCQSHKALTMVHASRKGYPTIAYHSLVGSEYRNGTTTYYHPAKPFLPGRHQAHEAYPSKCHQNIQGKTHSKIFKTCHVQRPTPCFTTQRQRTAGKPRIPRLVYNIITYYNILLNWTCSAPITNLYSLRPQPQKPSNMLGHHLIA